MLIALVLVPTLAGLLALALGSARLRWRLMLAAGLAHAVLSALAVAGRPMALGGWLHLDALGAVFLAITSLLFVLATVYLGAQRRDSEGQPSRVFAACLLLFLAAMTLVTVSHHLGLLWVAVEATTLASAPLIYHHKSAASLEAAWKYLVICSVGIALALLGTFLLVLSAPRLGDPLVLEGLLRAAPTLDRPLLRAAFLFLLVGYGTKVGLAPLHTWLPDAHSEAPTPASALLSGALLNTAFLALLRGWQVVVAAGMGEFASRLLIAFGLLSIVLAAAYIVGQRDYKRMLAYSSMEHMGILALAVGLAGGGSYGAMLHALNHSLAKALLFMLAGNILIAYGTKNSRDIRGVTRRLPWTGALWIAGFLAISGSPPFGLFLSELVILKATLDQGRFLIAALLLAALAVVFAGMGSIVLRMAQGQPADDHPRRTPPTPWGAIVPPALLAAAVLVLGLYIPAPVDTLLREAAALLGGRP